MHIKIKNVDDFTFIAKGDTGHWVPMDASPQMGGTGAAPSPMEFLLFGLGGCTGIDIVLILKKRKKQLDNFEIQIEAQRAENHPKIYTDIHIKYKFWGKNITTAEVERAIELSESKYCSASVMLGKTAKISYEYEINPPS